jgi:hypothetical protein
VTPPANRYDQDIAQAATITLRRCLGTGLTWWDGTASRNFADSKSRNMINNRDRVNNKGGSMETAGPTSEEWRELYRAAMMFREFGPWQWMDDSHVFGIKDPESGEIGYCCVIGALEELLGLLVYGGSEGLSVLEGIRSGRLASENEDLHAIQRCLSFTFEDREMLDKRDLGVIKTLGLKFRGRQAWPLFRSHIPGFAPWFVSGSEARFLGLALRQTMGVAERLREAPALLKPPVKGRYLVLSGEKKGEDVWHDEWVEPAPYEKRKVTASVDELRLARIKTGSQRVEDSWEVDFFFAPFVVTEGERPSYPYAAFYAVHKAGYVLNFTLAQYVDFEGEFTSGFLDFLEKTKVLPKAIMVKKDAVYDFFKPVAEKLGIAMKKVKELKSIRNAMDSMANDMGQ